MALFVTAMMPSVCHGISATTTHPLQYPIIIEGESGLRQQQKRQTDALVKISGIQYVMGFEDTKMRQWQEKYNKYLKTVDGFADKIHAGTTLYAEGVEVLRNLYDIKRACTMNPQGIAATFAMNDIYNEVLISFVKVYRILQVSVKTGGKNNMLTNADRVELLWRLNTEMEELNSRLRRLATSLYYYNLIDVWNQYTIGMTDRGVKQIAGEAFDRWKRCNKVLYMRYGN